MLGERGGFDAMGNARKNFFVGEIFDAVSDGEKFVRLGDGILGRWLSLDPAPSCSTRVE